MISYANTHFALDKLREEATKNGGEGPNVIVVGPNNSGKTSLIKLLTAYALRTGKQPVIVNTDSREGIISLPGSLTATPFASIVDVEQGWGSSPTSTSTPVPVKLPLCYFYGLPSPEDNTKLYKPILTRLALAVRGRLAEDKVVKETGIIIDTPGVISQGKNGYELIAHIVEEFAGEFSRIQSRVLILTILQPISFSSLDQNVYTARLSRNSPIKELTKAYLSQL